MPGSLDAGEGVGAFSRIQSQREELEAGMEHRKWAGEHDEGKRGLRPDV